MVVQSSERGLPTHVSGVHMFEVRFELEESVYVTMACVGSVFGLSMSVCLLAVSANVNGFVLCIVCVRCKYTQNRVVRRSKVFLPI